MQGEAMGRIVTRLTHELGDLGSRDALEFFARDGSWQTTRYMSTVKSLTAWEIDPIFEAALKENCPKASVHIGDSYELAKLPENRERFGWIVFDNPQMEFGPGGVHCEHFDALDLLPLLAAKDCVVIFNINWHPFEYQRQPAWQKRRNAYYKVADASHLERPFLAEHYLSLLMSMGFSVPLLNFEPRNQEYLTYCYARLLKESMR